MVTSNAVTLNVVTTGLTLTGPSAVMVNTSATFSGVFTNSNGTPRPGATVTLYVNGNSVNGSNATTAADGSYSISASFNAAGTYAVTVQAAGATSPSNTLTVTVAPAHTYSPALAVNPSSFNTYTGGQNVGVTYTGSGYQPNSPITMVITSGAFTGISLGQVAVSDSNGNFTATFYYGPNNNGTWDGAVSATIGSRGFSLQPGQVAYGSPPLVVAASDSLGDSASATLNTYEQT